MMNFGSKNVRGGFFGTRRLVGFYLHGPDGEVLDSQTFDSLDNIDPPESTETPTLPPTFIGTVTVAGFATPNAGQQVTYSVSNDGDAGNLSYAWSIVGGTGSSSTPSCVVDWGAAGPGQVTCTITSADEQVQDSPASDTLDVTIQLVPTSIGSLSINGDFSVTEGDIEPYSVTNTGDASNITYLWSVTGGTFSGTNTNSSCTVIWGAVGNGSISCTLTSSDPAVTDSPKTGTVNVTITGLPTPNAPTNVSITTSDYNPVVPTSIGTVTVSGEDSPTEGDVDTYSVTNDGDAGNLSYSWTIVGGTGSSTTDSCEVTWGADGAGSVSCSITSGDDAPTDSPASDSLSVTINAVPTTAPPTTTPAPSAPDYEAAGAGDSSFNVCYADDSTVNGKTSYYDGTSRHLYFKQVNPTGAPQDCWCLADSSDDGSPQYYNFDSGSTPPLNGWLVNTFGGGGTNPAPTLTNTTCSAGGITPVNDNQMRFYLPDSATSLRVYCATDIGYFKLTDGTNSSAVGGASYYTGAGYSSMYFQGYTEITGLGSGDKVVRLQPCDVNGTYDPSANLVTVAMNANITDVDGIDISYCTGLRICSLPSINAATVRSQFGAPTPSTQPATITEIRAVNCSLGNSNQSLYSPTWTPYAIYYWGGGIDLGGQALSAVALDQFYTDLANGQGGLVVNGNPGSSSDNPSIATGKGYTVWG